MAVGVKKKGEMLRALNVGTIILALLLIYVKLIEK